MRLNSNDMIVRHSIGILESCKEVVSLDMFWLKIGTGLRLGFGMLLKGGTFWECVKS